MGTHHSSALRALVALTLALALTGAYAHGKKQAHGRDQAVRFATFNASLNRGSAGQLVGDLSGTANDQARTVAEIVQRIDPDVLLINEFDFEDHRLAADLFRANYLEQPQHADVDPIRFPFVYVAPSNTGLASGHDLDNNGSVGGPNDAFGFGFFPGQFGMVVYSKYPIARRDVRTFQNFLWRDMPGALLPDDPATPAAGDWYSADELNVFRLSSKSHWDVPIVVGGRVVHALVSHPTPPVFDDPPTFPAGVDFNGRRNYDEIRFWADYVSGGRRARYVYDDRGHRGGLEEGSAFVIMGDLNSDPVDGDSIPGSAQLLLEHPRINTSRTPSSFGALEASLLQGGANAAHVGNPAYDTADFADGAPGNLRADYVLPSKDLRIKGSGVFWPLSTEPEFGLVGVFPFPSSDHRAAWVDVRVPGTARRGRW
jgi:hypothetical protein